MRRVRPNCYSTSASTKQPPSEASLPPSQSSVTAFLWRRGRKRVSCEAGMGCLLVGCVSCQLTVQQEAPPPFLDPSPLSMRVSTRFRHGVHSPLGSRASSAGGPIDKRRWCVVRACLQCTELNRR